MKLNKPKNPNYCFTIVKVRKDIALEGKDKIVHKNIFGNMVITGKDSLPEGNLAIYIPVECQLSEDYCKYNNLYDKPELNIDQTKKGYISSKKRRIKVKECHYDNEGIYASRKIIKNENLNPTKQDWYKEKDDWRKLAHESIFPYLSEGMTAYYEIVGYTPSGNMIQKHFDYGFFNPQEDELDYTEGTHFGVFIYRLTYTNEAGKVFEFSAKQVQEWCKLNDLKAVPELYYGKVSGMHDYSVHGEDGKATFIESQDDINLWRNNLLITLKDTYWYSQCNMCKSKVPSEGIVVRRESFNLEAWKYKSHLFLMHESKLLDTYYQDIESVS